MTDRGKEHILGELTEIMRQGFPDREYSGTVDLSTRVFADLGLSSIEVVLLAEKLESFYGQKLPFGPFLNELRESGAEDLELGVLVEFLQEHVG